MKKILVTGGTGFIGSHTVVELQQKGYEVIVVDNLSNSYAEVVDRIEKISGVRPHFEKIDLADRELTMRFFAQHHDIDAIIHFAAYKAVGESVAEPLKYYHNNIGSLLNIMEGMRQFNIRHLVFSSSCTVYGQPEQLPVKESSPIQKAWSPYGNTKQIAEAVIADSVTAYGLNAIALRYFNPIGSHPTAFIGEFPLGVPNNLVPFITQTAMGIRRELSVFGSDYNTVDGTCIRDYIHVVDLAKAHVVAVDRMLEEKQKQPFEVFNIGTGNGYSVLEVIHSFEKVSGQKLNYKMVDRRSGDVEQVWADTTFANEELGWKAEMGLDEMMETAWRWELALKERSIKE